MFRESEWLALMNPNTSNEEILSKRCQVLFCVTLVFQEGHIKWMLSAHTELQPKSLSL